MKRQLPGGIINLYTPEKDWHDMGIVIYAPFRELGVEDGFLQMMITREDYLKCT